MSLCFSPITLFNANKIVNLPQTQWVDITTQVNTNKLSSVQYAKIYTDYQSYFITFQNKVYYIGKVENHDAVQTINHDLKDKSWDITATIINTTFETNHHVVLANLIKSSFTKSTADLLAHVSLPVTDNICSFIWKG